MHINNHIPPSISSIFITVFVVAIITCGSSIYAENVKDRLVPRLDKDTVSVLDFSNGEKTALTSWKEKSFKGNTLYQEVVVGQRRAIKAQTNGEASALYREIHVDLDKTPYLNWSWRVENIYPINNERVKRGDDFAARVYVIVREGIFPWQTRALNYVWSNDPALAEALTNEKNQPEQAPNIFWLNPFTDHAAMIPVQAGSNRIKDWHMHKVNIKADYYRVFGKQISNADGVALMADADNAGYSATSFFGPIFFSRD